MLGVAGVRTSWAWTVVVRLEDESNRSNSNRLPSPPPLFFSKPSWVVRTESNVRKLVRKKPEPACVVCHGSGRVDCFNCSGKGRTNFTHLAMLPEGEWPKWCNTCGGSGLISCCRCLGTGEYRSAMGFHFMKDSDVIKQQHHQQQHLPGQQTAADRFLRVDKKDEQDA